MEALQHPSLVFKDSELAASKVETTGMGLPFARSGGFALTFKLIGQNKTWAVRLFQKDRLNDKLAERYGAIARGIKNSGLPYFVDFSFLPAGISIQTKTYSCVKMGWAEGTVLGTFIEKNKNNKPVLQVLRRNIQKLAEDMAKAGLAHGDFQTDNLLVSASGALKFVDYDAFFVPEIRSLGAIEVGYPNFQHPQRTRIKPYDEKLDRFSCLVIDSALNSLISNPSLWGQLGGDPQGLLVRASDFSSPHTSVAFHSLALDPVMGLTYKRLAAICEGSYSDVPTLTEFLSGKGPVPLVLKPLSKTVGGRSATQTSVGPAYQSRASRVISVEGYTTVSGANGQFVELVGKVKSVVIKNTKYGKPYVFILFGPQTGPAVYAPVWSEGLHRLSAAGFRVDSSLVGKSVSITGIIDAAYTVKTWTRVGITIEDANQITIISESEAKFRLASGSVATTSNSVRQPIANTLASRNAEIAARAKKASVTSSTSTSQNPKRSYSNQRQSSQPRPKQKSLWQSFLDIFK